MTWILSGSEDIKIYSLC